VATMTDVARLARTSVATVSAIVNGSARVSPALAERVKAAIAETGYRPDGIARSLRKGQTHTIGLLVTDIANPFFTAVVRSVEDAAQARGYAVFLCNSDEDLGKERTYVGLLRTRRIDGLILVPCGSRRDYESLPAGLGAPIVFVDRVIPGVPVDSVAVDNARASQAAIEHLLRLGHRRIGIVTGLPHLSTSAERLKGYRRALRKAGIEIDADLIRQGDFRQDGALQATQSLLALGRRPTAIFASNNLMAIGTMLAIRAAGLDCPADVSLACFDDFDWAGAFHPRLTVLRQPTVEIGRRAMDFLFDRLAGGAALTAPPRRALLKAELVIRESCAPPRSERWPARGRRASGTGEADVRA
jgi:LacI family transcriptional regulator